MTNAKLNLFYGRAAALPVRVSARGARLRANFSCFRPHRQSISTADSTLNATSSSCTVQGMGRTSEATTPSASPQKKRQRKQEKEKGKVPAQVRGGGQAGPSSISATNNVEGLDEDEEWSWLSMTDASPSRHPPVFTKDGRCARHRTSLRTRPYEAVFAATFSLL